MCNDHSCSYVQSNTQLWAQHIDGHTKGCHVYAVACPPAKRSTAFEHKRIKIQISALKAVPYRLCTCVTCYNRYINVAWRWSSYEASLARKRAKTTKLRKRNKEDVQSRTCSQFQLRSRVFSLLLLLNHGQCVRYRVHRRIAQKMTATYLFSNPR